MKTIWKWLRTERIYFEDLLYALLWAVVAGSAVLILILLAVAYGCASPERIHQPPPAISTGQMGSGDALGTHIRRDGEAAVDHSD